MVYPIVKLFDPVLEREADVVTEFDTPELQKLIDDMFDSIYAAKGVGLVAPQIGSRASPMAGRTGPDQRLRPTGDESSSIPTRGRAQ